MGMTVLSQMFYTPLNYRFLESCTTIDLWFCMMFYLINSYDKYGFVLTI